MQSQAPLNLRTMSHSNCIHPSDMPLANPKEQTLLWQQNSYLIDSGIASASNSHATPSLCGKDDLDLDCNQIILNWNQNVFGEEFPEEEMDVSHGNYNKPLDMPLTNLKEQTLLWQQNSYMIDSGYNTHPPPSLCGNENDDLDTNQLFNWDLSDFGQEISEGQMEEIYQQLNQTQSDIVEAYMFPENLEDEIEMPSTQFDPTQSTALESVAKPSQISKNVNHINYQDDASRAKWLVSLLSDEDQIVVSKAAMMLEQLLEEEVSRHEMLNLPQMVTALVYALTSSDDQKTTVYIAKLLDSLSQQKQGSLAIYLSNTIPALVELLSSPVEKVLFYTITTLHNLLLQQKESIMAVRLAGGLQKMVSLLQKNNVKFLTIVTACLHILVCGNRESKRIILASGGPVELVRIMRSYTSEMLLSQTLKVLKVLSQCSENKPVIVQTGGVQALAMHLGHQNQHLVLDCLLTLRFLSDAATKLDNVDGLLLGLIQLLDSSNIDVVTCTAGILSNMTCNGRNKVTVCQVGGIEALVQAVIKAGDREEITEPAVCALRHLTNHHPAAEMAQKAVCMHYGLQIIIKLLYPPSRWPLIKAVNGLIKNLSLCTTNHAPLQEYGAIQGLVQLLIKAYQQSNVTSSDNPVATVDGIRMVEVMESTIGALHNLACEAQNRAIIRGLNVIPLFVQLIYSEVEKIRRCATDVLLKLAEDKECVKMIEATGVAPFLTELIYSRNEDVYFQNRSSEKY